jgi:hypothetical protein
MSISIPRPIKRILRPFIRIIASMILWLYLFIKFYLFKNNKDSIPVILVNLSMNCNIVFNMNPDRIKYHIEDPDIMADNLFVWYGEWDDKIIDIQKHEKFEALSELLVQKKEYKDIGFYSFALNEDRQGNTLKRGNLVLDSEQGIIEYFRRQERLFKKIKEEGFDIEKAPETGIVITREGRLAHYRQGHHTLAIAKILGADMIKVRIRAVHSLWLKKHLKKDGFNYLKSIRSGIEEIKNGS